MQLVSRLRWSNSRLKDYGFKSLDPCLLREKIKFKRGMEFHKLPNC